MGTKFIEIFGGDQIFLTYSGRGNKKPQMSFFSEKFAGAPFYHLSWEKK